MSSRAEREVAHGARLSQGDPDQLWGWKTPAGERRALRRAGLLIEATGLGPGVRALEIGCGTGMFTAHFVETGAEITAIDLSSDLLAHARRRLPGVRLILGDFLREEVGDSFDVIVGSSVLHHLPVSSAIARMRGLLKPGGRLAFAEPNYLNPQVFLERRLRFLPYYSAYTSPDETAFVRWSLSTTLGSAGFDDVVITPHDWLHPSTPVTMLDHVSLLGRRIERLPILREFAGSLLVVARRSG